MKLLYILHYHDACKHFFINLCSKNEQIMTAMI